MTRLPSISVLCSFEAAAKHQNYTLAAEELGVTQAAISRKVRELEGVIGVALFRKAGRGVELTGAGRALEDRLHGDLDRLRATIDLASASGDAEQRLTLAVLPTFSAQWLVPRLANFMACHPGFQFALQSRTEPFDLVKAGVDLAIHFGRKEWVGGKLAPLFPENLIAVASPAMIERMDIKGPQDVERLPLLHLSTRRSAWAAYFAALGLRDSTAYQGTLFDQFTSLIAGAVSGMGAAIVPSYFVENELQQGALVGIGTAPTSDDMYYVVTPTNLANPATDTFRAWITSRAKRPVGQYGSTIQSQVSLGSRPLSPQTDVPYSGSSAAR